MKKFRLPDGSFVEFPDDLNQDEIDWIRQNKAEPLGPTGAQDLIKSMMSGVTEGAARAPLIGGDIAALGGTLVNKVRPGTIPENILGRLGSQPWIDAFRGSPADKATGGLLAYEPQTGVGRLGKAGTSAIAGGATLGGLKAIPGLTNAPAGMDLAKQALRLPSVLINGGAGVAAEAGTEVSGNPLVGMATGIAAAGVGNAIRTGRARNFQEGLYDATKDMDKKSWRSAADSLEEFSKSGSKAFTLADLPELQGRIGGAARDITNTTGGEALRAKLSGRGGTVSPSGQVTGPIPELLQGAAGVVPPVLDPRALATSLAAKGDASIKAAAAPIYTARDGQLAALGNADPIRLLAATNRYVRKLAFAAENQGTGTQRALNKAETALLGEASPRTPLIASVQPPVLNIQALSKNVKALRNPPVNDTESPARNISRHDAMLAADAAENALDKATRGGFRQAMSQYKASKEAIIDPMKGGLPGSISGASDAKGLLSALRSVPEDRLLGELNTAGISPADAKGLARLVGENLRAIPDATKGASKADIADRRLFDQLLEYADPSLKAEAGRKLKVADALSRLDAEHSSDATQLRNMQKNWVQWLNLAVTASFRNSLAVGRKEAQSMSELLANPSPQNLEKLRRLSLFDPRAKKYMDWFTGWSAAGTTSGGRSE